MPYPFPRDWPTLLRIALNRSADARYDPRALPRLAPFLFRYWRNSEPRRHAAIARAYAPLIEACLAGAKERREPWGVWGGELFVQGVVVARKRPRGRPRKNPVAA